MVRIVRKKKKGHSKTECIASYRDNVGRIKQKTTIKKEMEKGDKNREGREGF